MDKQIKPQGKHNPDPVLRVQRKSDGAEFSVCVLNDGDTMTMPSPVKLAVGPSIMVSEQTETGLTVTEYASDSVQFWSWVERVMQSAFSQY